MHPAHDPSPSREDRSTPPTDILLGEAHPRDLALLYRQLAATLNAGIGLSRAVSLAAEGTSGRLGVALGVVERLTAQGCPLSRALMPRQQLFGPVAVRLLAAGDASGRLVSTLQTAAAHFERKWTLQQMTRRAMVYPIMLLVTMGLVSVVLAYVLQGPAEAVGAFLAQGATVAEIVLVVVAVKALSRLEGPGALLDALILAVPPLAAFARKNAAARFVRTLGDLYDAGIGSMEAVEIAAEACGNRVMGRGLLRAKAALAQGVPMTEALAATGQLPGVALQMLATGEESGSVGFSLSKVAEYLESELDTATHSFMRALPVLLWAAVALPMIGMIFRMAGGLAAGIHSAMGSP